MRDYLKTLFWQPPWIPLGFVMALGLFIGIIEVKADEEIDISKKLWRNEITYFIHSQCNDQTKERIQLAATEASIYSVQIEYSGTSNNYNQDKRNTIGCAFDSPFADALMLPSEDGLVYEDQQLTEMMDGKLYTLGHTRTWHYPSTGEIVEFDMWLNEYWMVVDSIAWQTIRHEWGHALGLPHSKSNNSLMAPANGLMNWDIGTIAQLALIYGRCEPRVDSDLNLWIPNISVRDPRTQKMRDVYAVMPSGAEWPLGVLWYGEALCGN